MMVQTAWIKKLHQIRVSISFLILEDESDIHSGINKSGAVAENDDAELAMEASTTVLNDILEAVKSEDTYVSLESSVENISRNDDSTSLSQNDDEVNNHGEL
jgi:hypothetical protein